MINNNTPQTISGKIKTRTPTQAEALSSRYVFLNLNNAEPNLGTPKSPGIKQEYLGDDGYRYLLLSNNTSSLSAWRVWSFDNPRIAAYSKENSIALGDNANPINNNSIVYNNHPYGTNVYNSQSFRDNSFNVFSLSGIYLFDATTIGDPASATVFLVTQDGKVGINTNSTEESLSIVGNVSATGNLTINTNATLGKGKTSTNILRGTVKIADSSPSSVVFGVSDANYDTNLYRGGANILKTDDLFVCDSLSAIGTLSAGNISVNNIRAGGNVTVNGTISSNSTITVLNGNSNQWNSVYTSFNTSSASFTALGSIVATLSTNSTFNLYLRNANLATLSNWTSAVSIPANINDLTGGGPCLVSDILCIIKSRSLNAGVPTTGNLFSTNPSFSLEDNAANSLCSTATIGKSPIVGAYYRTANGVGTANASGKFTYNGGAARVVGVTQPVYISTTLSSAVLSSVLALPINVNTAFSNSDFHVKVDNEIMYVSNTTGSGTSFTVTRGQLGTVAAPHALGATVTANIATDDMLLVDACFVMKRFEN